MTSKIVVNNIEADTGVSTVTFGSEISASKIVTSSGEFTVGTGASVYSPTTNVLALGTNNAERVRIDSIGRVGINTTTFVETRDSLIVAPASGETDTFLTIKTTRTNGQTRLHFADPDDSNPGDITYQHSINAFQIKTADEERIRIDSTGNVGIGTDNPDEKLEVYGGKIFIDGGGNRKITLDPGSNTTYDSRIDASHSLVFRSYVDSGAGVKTCTFDTNGDLDLTQGRNLKFAPGQGIDFSATANSSGSTSSEVLDDYEEGTWTPDLRFAGSNTGITYSWRNGHYTKIGRQVTVRGAFGLSSRGTFNATDDAFIYGLPFDVAPYGVTGGFHYMFGSAYNGYQGLFQLELQHSSSFSDHVPISRQTAWNSSVSPMEYQDIGGSQRMAFIFSYFTAS